MFSVCFASLKSSLSNDIIPTVIATEPFIDSFGKFSRQKYRVLKLKGNIVGTSSERSGIVSLLGNNFDEIILKINFRFRIVKQ